MGKGRRSRIQSNENERTSTNDLWLLSITKGCMSFTLLLDYTLARLVMYAYDLSDVPLLLYGACISSDYSP